MAQWATFTGITGVVLVLLLVLSYLTQTAFSDGDDSTAGRDTDRSSPQSSPSPSVSSSNTATSASPSSARDDDRSAGADGAATDDSHDADSSSDARDSSASTDGPGDETVETDVDTDAEPESESEFESESATSVEAATDANADAERSNPVERTADERSTRAPSERPIPVDGDAEVGPPSSQERGRGRNVDPQSLSTGELLANVALSQGLFACVLLGAVVYTGIPADALGIEFSAAYLREGLVLGTAAGLVLYVANEIGAAAATHFGFDHDEQLRSLLAPDSLRGWLVLLLAVLPLIAGFEELLFRAALIGAISSGYAVDPWLLAVVSSVAFAVGHGMQGSIGVVVTGLLGFVLAAIFIVTGSFLVVVVAHYLINALEFAVHEGLELDWTQALESESESEGHS